MPLFDIVAKSGIMHVPESYPNYAATGLPPRRVRIITPLLFPIFFPFAIPLPPTRYTENSPFPVQELGLFCKLLNATTHDSMVADAKDRKYRMYSRLQLDASVNSTGDFVVRVAGQNTSALNASSFVTDVGMEGGKIEPPPLRIEELRLQMPNRNSYIVEWLTLGRPHPMAELAFAEICWRNCQYIWHKVSLLIERTPSGITCTPTLAGSCFPTHGLWINGTKRLGISQAAIGNLWISHASSSSRCV
jgi:hypothetical protein